jgi:hypothetical protein
MIAQLMTVTGEGLLLPSRKSKSAVRESGDEVDFGISRQSAIGRTTSDRSSRFR